MLIKNGRIFYNGDFVEKSILIEEEKIKKIGSHVENEESELIDAKGLLILPGLIDPHVHLREPGAEYKEDFRTGTRAAIAGGVTTVIDMPNNPLPTITVERLREKERLAKQKALCDVYFHFGATYDNFDEIKKANPLSLKIYMGKTTGTLLIKDDETIEKHFQNFDKRKPIVLHAEDADYLGKYPCRSEEAARIAVARAVALAKKTNRIIHIAHVSTRAEIDEARKFDGCTVETAPHYLFLSKKYAEKNKSLGLVRPPLRSESERRALWQMFDKINCIATDHAPHTLEDKENGANGFPGLETSLALMLDAYNRRLVSIADIVAKMAENAAKIFNLPLVGKIEFGYLANLIFVDVKEEWKVRGEELETKCKWSPFDGKLLKGKVKKVIVRGKLIYDEGDFFSTI
jgi:dihydroorotase